MSQLPLRINNKVKQAASNSWAKHPTDTAKSIGEVNIRRAEAGLFGGEKTLKERKKKISEATVGDIVLLDVYKCSKKSGHPASSVWLGEEGKEPELGKYAMGHICDPERRWFYFSGKFSLEILSAERNKRDRKMDCVGKVLSYEPSKYLSSIRREGTSYETALKRIIGSKVLFKI